MRRLAVSVPCFEIGEILSEVCNETALPLVVRSKNVIDCLGLYSAASVHCSAIPVPKVGDLQSNPHRREYTSDRYCRTLLFVNPHHMKAAARMSAIVGDWDYEYPALFHPLTPLS